MGSPAMKPRAARRRTRPTARTRQPPRGRLQWLDEASGGGRTSIGWLASVLRCPMCHTCQTSTTSAATLDLKALRPDGKVSFLL